jgi:hypothetical protein
MIFMSRWDVVGFPKRLVRNKYIGKAAGVAAIVLVGITGAVVGSQEDLVPAIYGEGVQAQILMDLYAPRDVGALPSRSTWCSDVRSADHCWLLQESSGSALDAGAGSWDLTVGGSPRQGVLSHLPVENGASNRTWDERGVFFDALAANYLSKTGVQSIGASALVSVTYIARSNYLAINDTSITNRDNSSPNYGWSVLYRSGHVISGFFDGPGGTAFVESTYVHDYDVACVTAVLDGRSAGAARIYVNGADVTSGTNDLSTAGLPQSVDSRMVLGNKMNYSTGLSGGLYRVRVDDQYAVSLAEHKALCGSLWQPPSGGLTGVAEGHVSYTQTGGARCFQTGSATAVCAPGGVAAYASHGSFGADDWGFVAEPGCVNRILNNTSSFNCTNWNCFGATTVLTPNAIVAPDGSKTAPDITIGTGFVAHTTVIGYNIATPMDVRMWVKCLSGGVIDNLVTSGVGDWRIDCTSLSDWTLIDKNHPAVTVITPMATLATSWAMRFRVASGGPINFSVWGYTATNNASGCYSIIPTGSTAVDTGMIDWQIANTGAAYYTGDRGRVTMTGDWSSGGCLDIDSAADNNGRSYVDGTDWILRNAAAGIVSQCDLALSGEDTAVMRWRSNSAIVGGHYTECLLNDVQQPWDVDPVAPWTPATPDLIHLAGYGSTSCSGGIQRLTIEDSP